MRSRFESLVRRIAKRLPYRYISGDRDEPYLIRYVLFQRRGRFGIYLHQYLASDPDRGLHDHPWRWSFGIPLVNGYQEERLSRDDLLKTGFERQTVRDVRVGQINRLGWSVFHRILLKPDTEGSVWSLFIHGKRVSGWGFINRAGDGWEFQTAGYVNEHPTAERLNYPPRPLWWLRKKEAA